MKIKLKIQKFLKTKFGAILWQITSSALILILAGGIGVFAAFAKTEGSAASYAKEYFKYFMTHSWSLMYKGTDLVNSQFVNEETFGEMMKTIVPERGSDKYEFVDRGSDDQYNLIDIVYTEKGSDIERTMTLRMKKKSEKTAFILNQWEVCMSDELIRNCTITAPLYVTISLDGVDISNCAYEDNTETGLRTYVIPEILAGTHKLELSTYGTAKVYETFIWENSRSNYTIQTVDFPLDGGTQAVCSDKAIDMVVGMYTGVLTNTGCESVKAFVATDEEKAGIDAVYNDLAAAVTRDDGATLVSMSFDSYDTSIADYVPAHSMAVKFVFQTTFSAKSGRTEMGGVRESYQGTTPSVGVVRFECRDGNWVPVRLELGCFDYGKPEEQG